ncbi:MAG: phenylalanine--tRNA ligase subunit beta [Candidatus Omnitrophota bacterium]|jgi:phenylalanyl-tRNA synthetase beta chain|nr:MAG: phenylalanine--tRNA ligase subunit beta [Candidatus Omnitrophota bacterium]
MKVTYNWLKDYVNIKMPAESLADKLTMAGLEVTSLSQKDGDYVFEIEITSNRPDWLSVIGIAKEVAAITNSKFKKPPSKGAHSLNRYINKDLRIKVQDPGDCPLYTGTIIRGVSVLPSPGWLRKRVEAIGCHSVNNVVDVTNYVLFEYGQPLHAFDLDRLNLNDGINVRRANAQENILTIDGELVSLDKGILVIADSRSPVAIAGIIGGKNTEVGNGTVNILLEAAVFNQALIRKARQSLGMQTESSYRFERGLDPAVLKEASLAAVQLISQVSNGKITAYRASREYKIKAKKIIFDLNYAGSFLGFDIGKVKINKTLSALGFTVKKSAKDKLIVGVPSQRRDINLAADLTEEIARIVGYDKVPVSLPAIRPNAGQNTVRVLSGRIKEALVGLGFNEIITYSLIDRGFLNLFGDYDNRIVEISNPLSRDLGILRPTIIPSIARCISYNLSQRQPFISLFEMGNVYINEGQAVKEQLVLGMTMCGQKASFVNSTTVKEIVGFRHLKGAIESLFKFFDINEYEFNISGPDSVSLSIASIECGAIRRLTEKALNSLDIKNRDIFIAELFLDKIIPVAAADKTYKPLPLYPAITRDISLIVKDTTNIADLIQEIKKCAGKLLEEAEISDYYRGQQIPAGYRSLTISCLYRSSERTLTDSEINSIHAKIPGALESSFDIRIR